MKTLIELFDERPVENILATEVFRPERVVFLCPGATAQDRSVQRTIRGFFEKRGIDTEPVFLEISIYNAEKIQERLKYVLNTYPDCVLDITGGTDCALFAGGGFCIQNGVPAFTYSRKNNTFFNIYNAPFANKMKCGVDYSVEDCFAMAGGALRMGRTDNAVLSRYDDLIEPFFEVFKKHRRNWPRIVGYIQRISQSPKYEIPPMEVTGKKTVKIVGGRPLEADLSALTDLENIGMISGLRLGEEVSFRFRDENVRKWLRDNGSVLELYIYKKLRDPGVFNDVVCSAVVDWDAEDETRSVTNEIDVMAMNGIVPVFVSCKTCDIDTDALNELAVLRDRFGGNMAEALIVTTEYCRAITRHRAEELGISVIDRKDMDSGILEKKIERVKKKKVE